MTYHYTQTCENFRRDVCNENPWLCIFSNQIMMSNQKMDSVGLYDRVAKEFIAEEVRVGLCTNNILIRQGKVGTDSGWREPYKKRDV